MSLVAIPLKHTGDVDLVKPITSLISGSRSVGADDKASLAELQALRVKMVSSIKNKTFTDATLRDMENYFDQLGCESNITDRNTMAMCFKTLNLFYLIYTWNKYLEINIYMYFPRI